MSAVAACRAQPLPRAARLAGRIALLALAAAGGARAEDRVGELLRRSGLDAQLTQVAGAVRVALLEREHGADDPRRVGRVLATADRAFAVERLRAGVRAALARLEAADVEAALVFLDSPAGRRITRAEVAASEPERLDRPAPGGEDAVGRLGSRRRALLERLERASAGSETRLELDLRLSVAVLDGVRLARPELPAPRPEEARRLFEARRGEILRIYRTEALGDSAAVYRPVSNGDLVRYVRFAESAAGRRYLRAVSAALLAALEQAGREFGELLAGERRT